MTPSKLAHEILELDEKGTAGKWEYKEFDSPMAEHSAWCVRAFGEFMGKPSEAFAFWICKDENKGANPTDGKLIAHFRSSAPTLARAYLELEGKLEKARKALKCHFPEAVFKRVEIKGVRAEALVPDENKACGNCDACQALQAMGEGEG